MILLQSKSRIFGSIFTLKGNIRYTIDIDEFANIILINTLKLDFADSDLILNKLSPKFSVFPNNPKEFCQFFENELIIILDENKNKFHELSGDFTLRVLTDLNDIWHQNVVFISEDLTILKLKIKNNFFRHDFYQIELNKSYPYQIPKLNIDIPELIVTQFRWFPGSSSIKSLHDWINQTIHDYKDYFEVILSN